MQPPGVVVYTVAVKCMEKEIDSRVLPDLWEALILWLGSAWVSLLRVRPSLLSILGALSVFLRTCWRLKSCIICIQYSFISELLGYHIALLRYLSTLLLWLFCLEFRPKTIPGPNAQHLIFCTSRHKLVNFTILWLVSIYEWLGIYGPSLWLVQQSIELNELEAEPRLFCRVFLWRDLEYTEIAATTQCFILSAWQCVCTSKRHNKFSTFHARTLLTCIRFKHTVFGCALFFM